MMGNPHAASPESRHRYGQRWMVDSNLVKGRAMIVARMESTKRVQCHD